jgi:purine-cytosine permease-like protein
LATGTVFNRIGHVSHNVALLLGFAVSVSLTVLGGILGFEVIMRLQKWLTLVTILMTVGYIALTFNSVNWTAVTSLPSGNVQSVIGAVIFAVTGIGLGWVNCAADYSRYLPRNSSSAGVIGWTVFGSSVVPIILVSYGALLAGSSKQLSESIAMDPIGALTSLLPSWYLIPFAIVAVLGLIGGAILDLYSSGLALISIGLPVKRHIAAGIDACIMFAGTIYIAWFANDFSVPFQGFLITLGVPLAAWSAIFVADVTLRKTNYSEVDLFTTTGRYGSWNRRSLIILAVGSIVGWGFVTNTSLAQLEASKDLGLIQTSALSLHSPLDILVTCSSDAKASGSKNPNNPERISASLFTATINATKGYSWHHAI